MLIILSVTDKSEKYSYYFSLRGYMDIYKLLMPFASEIDVRTARCGRIKLYVQVKYSSAGSSVSRLDLSYLLLMKKGDSMGCIHIILVFDEGTSFI